MNIEEKIDNSDSDEKEDILRLSKDEMNLVEHPFGSLSKEKDTRTIELRWQTQHPVSNKLLDAHWKVMGTPELGLPTANDEKVYLVAMELTREQGWPRQVHFTRRDLLRRLGWSDNDESYRRLYDALSRLSTVSIQTKNAFYHPRSGHYIDGVFHLVDRFVIAGEGPGRKPNRSRYDGEPPTFLVWSEPLHQSFINGNIRSIDLDFALSLERPLSLRLFRYLDKKRHGANGEARREFEIGLRELCGAHLGMVIENRFDSNLKASLEPAHQELLSRGFLHDASYEKMKSRRGMKVVYRFAAAAATGQRALDFSDGGETVQLLLPQIPSLWDNASTPRPAPALAQAELPTSQSKSNCELLERLHEVGVSPTVAQQLVEEFSEEQIELQLGCLSARKPKNPAAALVKAIRQNWNPPTVKPTASTHRTAPHPNPIATQQVDLAQVELENQHLDALWHDLEPTERDRLEAQVQTRLGILGGAGRAPAAAVAMRRTLLREIAEQET